MARTISHEGVSATSGVAERGQQRLLTTADFMVAGVSYEGRASIVSANVHVDDRVFLVRDPRNQYSRNAIQVRLLNGLEIGFVPEEDAVILAPLLDKGASHHAHVKKVLTRGRLPVPVVVARIYRSDAAGPEAVLQSEVSERQVPQFGTGRNSTRVPVKRKIEVAIKKCRYISFKYRKAGASNPCVSFAFPRAIKDHLLVAYEYTREDRYNGKLNSFILDLIEDLKVMPDCWTPDFEWRERKVVVGDLVVKDTTTLKQRRKGCVASAVFRKRRRGILRWLFGD